MSLSISDKMSMKSRKTKGKSASKHGKEPRKRKENEAGVGKKAAADAFRQVSGFQPTSEDARIHKALEGSHDESMPEQVERVGEFQKPLPAGEENEPKGKKGKGKKEEGIGREKRVEILKNFTKEVLKKYGPLIRSIVLFGSTARNEFRGESDIDVFIIVDDTRHKISPQLQERMEEDFDKFAKAQPKKLSVQQ